ncbi:MAG: S-methyl-5-thioribose-1-phosphate isomerase [Lentisphaeraceae bacterium]|nr:S-methyl-5-thioribose-1-phosphate isomerase [Lentisphaeraceae bacterium]
MNISGKHYRTIWLNENNPQTVQVIDQRHLPHKFVIEDIKSVNDMAVAIKDMHVRGAGLIGAAAAYGMYLSALNAPTDTLESFTKTLEEDAKTLQATRPTAVNLAWAVKQQLDLVHEATIPLVEKLTSIKKKAQDIADQDAHFCEKVGQHGLSLIEEISQKKNGDTVNILTHCNAGWLAFVDHGSATSPIYAAHNKGIKVHVWVDETRPRNQGARLTAWELEQHGVPYSVIADNVGGHLMQHKLVDLVITGSDRTTFTGDVCNKIGTYLKALAAQDNNIPFYVALPSSTFDWQMRDGVKEIPIEERDMNEVKTIQGLHDGKIKKVLLTQEQANATNYAFDVTPARLVTGLITERGICSANEESIKSLYPEKFKDNK